MDFNKDQMYQLGKIVGKLLKDSEYTLSSEEQAVYNYVTSTIDRHVEMDLKRIPAQKKISPQPYQDLQEEIEEDVLQIDMLPKQKKDNQQGREGNLH